VTAIWLDDCHATTGGIPLRTPHSSPALSSPADVATSRVADIYRQVRDLIVSGKLTAGTAVIDSHVAGRLGASRTTVRTALHQLQQEGYLVSAKLGTYSRVVVAPLRHDDAWELARIVGAIEALAAEDAARLEPARRNLLVKKMRNVNAGLLKQSKSRRPDPRRLFELDTAFHRSYVEAAGSIRLAALHDVIKPQWERYGRLYASAIIHRLHISVEEHDRIIDAINRANPSGAHTAVRDTWRGGAERLAEMIRGLGEHGSW
jgi:DNA-binding GntR family transcriptional regulator